MDWNGFQLGCGYFFALFVLLEEDALVEVVGDVLLETGGCFRATAFDESHAVDLFVKFYHASRYKEKFFGI